MERWRTLVLLWLLCLGFWGAAPMAVAQESQTPPPGGQTASNASPASDNATGTISGDDDDFDPGIFFGAMFFLCILIAIALIILGVGCVLGAMLGAMAVGLALAGATSTAILVGLARRSVSDGVRTLVLVLTTLGGLVVSASAGWASGIMFHWPYVPTAWVGMSALAGALAGFLVGRISNRAWSRLVVVLLAWWRKRMGETGPRVVDVAA